MIDYYIIIFALSISVLSKFKIILVALVPFNFVIGCAFDIENIKQFCRMYCQIRINYY